MLGIDTGRSSNKLSLKSELEFRGQLIEIPNGTRRMLGRRDWGQNHNGIATGALSDDHFLPIAIRHPHGMCSQGFNRLK